MVLEVVYRQLTLFYHRLVIYPEIRKNIHLVTTQALGVNPRILMIYRGEAPVNHQNSGAFPIMAEQLQELFISNFYIIVNYNNYYLKSHLI
jgi:hypothetical protein